MLELMKSNKLTQKELAARVGVTESAISYYVRGDRTPRSDVLTRIARAFGVTTDYLLESAFEDALDSPNVDLQYLQRNLNKLNNEQLKRAKIILKAAFYDAFDEE